MAESVNGEKKDNSRDRIAAIVLAAGESTRFSPLGEPKQLVTINGEPMIAKVVREVIKSTADAVLVVLGHEFERVSAALKEFLDIHIVCNHQYRDGLAGSLKAGIAHADGFDAVMFVLGDLPGLTADDINSVISAYRNSTAQLACAIYEGRPAHPVIFRKDLWPELEELEGDVGGREVVKRHLGEAVKVEMPNAASTIDIDTLQDYLPLSGGSNSE